mgnify:CR=1 FL=1
MTVTVTSAVVPIRPPRRAESLRPLKCVYQVYTQKQPSGILLRSRRLLQRRSGPVKACEILVFFAKKKAKQQRAVLITQVSSLLDVSVCDHWVNVITRMASG